MPQVLSWWKSLSEVEKASKATIAQLIHSAEGIISEERLAYINLPTFDDRAAHLLATLTTILYACRPPAAEG